MNTIDLQAKQKSLSLFCPSIQYKIDTMFDKVDISTKEGHLGCIWGKIDLSKNDEFENEHLIIKIYNGDKLVAWFWNAIPKKG